MKRKLAGALICLLVGMGVGAVVSGAAGSKYPKTPWLAGLQFAVPYLTFEDCQKQAFPALRKEGLDDQYKGPRRSWYGRGPGGVAATIFCYEGPDGEVWVTIVSAHESFDPAAKTSQDLLKRLNGSADWAGGWTSQYGDLQLQQDGDNVTGTWDNYSCGAGTISGTTSTQDNKPVLDGTWTVNDPAQCPGYPAYDGPLTWTLTTSSHFDGTWSYSDGSPGGTWAGDRKQ